MNRAILIFRLYLCYLCYLMKAKASDVNSILDTEESIIKSILNSSYDKTIRPSVTVDISIRIALKQIIALDERNQVMITASYLFVSWYDSRLKWNSNETNSVDTISVKAKNLWLPDLYITNTAEQNGFILVTDSNLAFIQSDGLVYFTLSLISISFLQYINTSGLVESSMRNH